MSDVSAAWTKASTNVSNRDKVLRVYYKLLLYVFPHHSLTLQLLQVFQYSSVMLLAYHKDSLSKESISMFQNIRSTASTARRSFRLLKSLNHIAQMHDMMKLLIRSECKNKLDMLFSMACEASWAVLYFYDNYVFLSRLGLFTRSPEENNSIFKKSIISWCVGESLKLVSLVLKHQSQQKELKVLLTEQERVKKLNIDGHSSVTNVETFLVDEIKKLESEGKELAFQYMKVSWSSNILG